MNIAAASRGESVMSDPNPPSFGSVLIHSCAIERHVPQTLLGVQIGKSVAALRGLTMNCAAASSKRAVLVLRVPLRLLVSAAGVAAIFSTSAPQGNEQDAQQGSYQSPQNEQTADAKLGIAARWQNQKRGQYQGQQAKGSIACHWLHFSQRQRGRARVSSGIYKSYGVRQPARRGSPSGEPIPPRRDLERALLASSAPSLGFRRQCVGGLAHLLGLLQDGAWDRAPASGDLKQPFDP